MALVNFIKEMPLAPAPVSTNAQDLKIEVPAGKIIRTGTMLDNKLRKSIRGKGKAPPKNKNQILFTKLKNEYTKEMKEAERNGDFKTYLDEYCGDKATFDKDRNRVFRTVVDRALMQ